MAERESLSPMMKQYLEIKDTCNDSLLFFRLGDFYEMFFDDAITASKELELTLTQRDCGLSTPAPMCGVPYHAVDTYLAKLIQKGYKVTICEQTTPPNKKGIIKREITRVVTPGTVTESNMLTEDKNNYIVGICFKDNAVGISWADISTGEFNHTFIEGRIAIELNDLLSRIDPAEIICNQDMFAESINLSIVKYGGVCPFTAYDESAFEYENAIAVLKSSLSQQNIAAIKHAQSICAAGALLSYIQSMQKCSMNNIDTLVQDDNDKYMIIDANTCRTLELTKSSASKNTSVGSLFWCLNKTKTGMGARMLRKWIEMPEIDVRNINARLDFVEELAASTVSCSKLQSILNDTYDIERLTSRLITGKITPDDFLSLSRSLRNVFLLKNELQNFKCELSALIKNGLPEFSEQCDLIDSAIFNKNEKSDDEQEKPKKKNKITERIFKQGYDSEADQYFDLIDNGNSILQQLVAAEREDTGIKGLKLGFNNVFGYYLEVPKAQIDMVPYRYTRKQTVASGERYVTAELKDLEEKMLHAEESLISRESYLYKEFIATLAKNQKQYLAAAKYIATLDCLTSFAVCAKENNYVKPVVNDGKSIKISEGRHPIVERLLKDENFVPNNTFVDSAENKIMLITGPNMAGKSIYMKQVALIVIMAQIGSFIPADSGEIGIVDKIFTRVGASDDLATGRSTFMVEMSEVANILQNATDNSLLLMDEIGRGTSTFDGLSLAWSILEYLSQQLNAKVLFSTHYHELVDLENVLPGIKNYKLTLREINNSIVFLRKVMRGSANRSFGIEVAGLAGLPNTVLNRAKEILKKLETTDLRNDALTATGKQMSLFVPEGKSHEITQILREIDTDNLTPRNALDILFDLKEKATANE